MIGVIGGNGVAATIKLLSLIEEAKTQSGAFRDSHHPEMLIWQATQAPSRSMYLEGRGPSWIEEYIDIGKKLKECGCEELCMCCNTAHYAIDVLKQSIDVNIVNLLDLVASKVASLGCKRAGLMCSDGLKKVGLYEQRFSIYAPNVDIVYPDNDYQELVTKGICNAKNSHRFESVVNNNEHPYNCFDKVLKSFINFEVDCVIAGCTDICNVYAPQSLPSNVHYVDSLRVLADYICINY